jgi:hypothetical protein
MEDERAREGLEHLQAAAREMIAAARAMLDVVEELVEDQDAVRTVVADVGALFGTVVRAAGERVGRPGGARTGTGGEDDEGDGPAERVERIRVT